MTENKTTLVSPAKIENELQVIARPAVQVDPKAEVAFAVKCADALMEVISQKPHKVVINGEQYLEFEDWQTIARFYQCTVSVEWTKVLEVDKVFAGYEARAVVLDSKGIVRSSAEANCTVAEARWRGREHFQIKSMAQTRACAKALRNVFAWVVVMKGFRATPAEEFPEYEKPVTPPANEFRAKWQPVEAQVVNPLADMPNTDPAQEGADMARSGGNVSDDHCLECNAGVPDVVREYSKKWFNGVTLCRSCQKLDKWTRTQVNN